MVLDARQLTVENSPINPIPYVAVKFSIALAGGSEWGSRFIPCVIGILSIPIILGLGRTLFNWRVGILASAFVAFSSWHLFLVPERALFLHLDIPFRGVNGVVFLSVNRTRFNAVDVLCVSRLYLSHFIAPPRGVYGASVSGLCGAVSPFGFLQQEKEVQPAHLFWAVRYPDIGTRAPESSRLPLLRLGAQPMESQSALHCADARPRREHSDSCYRLLWQRYRRQGTSRTGRLSYRWFPVSSSHSVSCLLCRRSAAALPHCIAIPKRRGLLSVLDNACVFPSRRGCV